MDAKVYLFSGFDKSGDAAPIKS